MLSTSTTFFFAGLAAAFLGLYPLALAGAVVSALLLARDYIAE